MFKLYACKDAKNSITKAIDTITDNLRLFENLNATLKKNMNGMNLRNSSTINEKNNGGTSIHVGLGPIRSPPTIPKFPKTKSIARAYTIYPTKRANARATSLAESFLNITV